MSHSESTKQDQDEARKEVSKIAVLRIPNYPQCKSKIILWSRYLVMRFLVEKYPVKIEWDMLRQLGNTKTVRACYLFVIMLPLLLQLIQAVIGRDYAVTMEAFGESYTYRLVLPLYWLVAYFAGLLFIIGNVLYMLRCPYLVREYADYRVYKDKGMVPQMIARIVLDIGRYMRKDLFFQIQSLPNDERERVYGDSTDLVLLAQKTYLIRLAHLSGSSLDSSQEAVDHYYETGICFDLIEQEMLGRCFDDEHFQKLFWHYWRYCNEDMRHVSRYVAHVLSVIGLSLLSLVSVLNIWHILKYLF